MILGAHLSIEGGLHKALQSAGRYGFEAVALFVRNQVQWRAPPLPEEAVRRFRRTRRRLGLGPVVAHGSYLVNLAGAPPVRRKSIEATLADAERCRRLGIEYLVLHPGANADAGTGVRLIAEALEEIIAAAPPRARRPMILLETTAGQGNAIGRRFEQLADVLARAPRTRRLGVCLDTCHVFAAGYDLRSPAAYERTMAAFDGVIGLRRLRVVHLNDSKRPLASGVDRHEHIGRGRIGRRGFANVVRDERLASVPMILETPKGKDPRGREWDAVNAAVIRRLAGRK